MIHRLHRRLTHLFALPAPCWRSALRILTVMLAEARVHVRLNRLLISQNVAKDALLDRPTEEIQLADRRLINGIMPTNLETNTVATTEGIKESFGIRLEFTLIMKVDHKLAIVHWIGHIELLGIVRHEPVNKTETDRRSAAQNGQDFLQAPRLIIEILEPADNEVLLALDTIFESLPFHLRLFRYRRFRWRAEICGEE
jgi:hypothetical protein